MQDTVNVYLIANSSWEGSVVPENKIRIALYDINPSETNDGLKHKIRKYIRIPEHAKWERITDDDDGNETTEEKLIAGTNTSGTIHITWGLPKKPTISSSAKVNVYYISDHIFMHVEMDVQVESSDTVNDLITKVETHITIFPNLKVSQSDKPVNMTSTMENLGFPHVSLTIEHGPDFAMSMSKKTAAVMAIAGASVLAGYTLSQRNKRRRKDLCAEIGLDPAVTTVVLRSPDRVSITVDGSPKLFQLPPRVTGGRSVCRRALSLVTNSEAEARSLFMLDLVRIVRKEDKTWIIVLDLPDSNWLPKPTALRSKLSSKGLGMVVADSGTSVLALSRMPSRPAGPQAVSPSASAATRVSSDPNHPAVPPKSLRPVFLFPAKRTMGTKSRQERRERLERRERRERSPEGKERRPL